MTTGITADQVMAGATVAGLIGTAVFSVAGIILHQKDKAQQAAMDAMTKEIVRMDASVKASWIVIDKLKDERAGYATRDDADKLRIEIKTDLANLGNLLVAQMTAMSESMRREVDRLIEGGAARR